MKIDVHRYEYLKRYRRENYRHFNILFDKRDEEDAKILEAFGKVPNKTQLVKKLLKKELLGL